ncbi:hypothetical protein EYF80_053769 [Liparis tanakae]|uniref:Uncharacterized protein n=1 Tax=Liparis tanakae TaxID=230148 RepID=A0A4Z2F4I6_9TELE|nr:hypothetical protein EYF80_053769 [Liparis tanakae]
MASVTPRVRNLSREQPQLVGSLLDTPPVPIGPALRHPVVLGDEPRCRQGGGVEQLEPALEHREGEDHGLALQAQYAVLRGRHGAAACTQGH